jgi:hypothetical protein
VFFVGVAFGITAFAFNNTWWIGFPFGFIAALCIVWGMTDADKSKAWPFR